MTVKEVITIITTLSIIVNGAYAVAYRLTDKWERANWHLGLTIVLILCLFTMLWEER